MKFWKFEYAGEADLERCVSERSLPCGTVALGLKDTDHEVACRMREGDGAVVGQLIGDQAKLYAVGRVVKAGSERGAPSVQWVKTINFRMPDERGGLIHWQTKTAFEISPEPAKRYGLRELVDHYVPNDA